MKRTVVFSALFILLVSLLMSGAGSGTSSLGVQAQAERPEPELSAAAGPEPPSGAEPGRSLARRAVGPGMVAAPTGPAGHVPVELVGQIGGPVTAVAVQGEYVYVGVGPRLVILHVSDPANPTMVGQSPVFPDFFVEDVKDVTVAGNYAYVAARRSGLRIVDVSDPAAPAEVGFYDTPGEAWGVAVAGDYAYVAAGDYGGLRIVDVSDPAAPAEVGFYDTPGYAQGVAVAGDHVYVADGSGGLRIVDVSDPAHPAEVGFYDTLGSAQAVAVAGDYAYVADYRGGLRIINVSDPAHPTEVGFYDTPGRAYGVAVAGDYAYVADKYSGLRIVDVSDPAAPAEVGFYNTPGYAWAVAVAGDYAYVADWDGGLRIVDVSDPAHPSEVGFCDTPGYAYGVAVAGDYAYVADGNDGLRIVDVSDPAHPVEVSFYDTPGLAVDVAVAGDHAYVADGSGGLVILRVRKLPATPRSLVAFQAVASPTLDGDLSEWAAIPKIILDAGTAGWHDYRGGPPPTRQDASLVLQVTWDSQHLYFGLHANDDLLVRDSGNTFWKDDEIEIWVDGNNDGQTWSSVYDHQYTFNTDGLVTDKGHQTNLQVAMQTVDGGWNVEVAVPRDHLPSGTLVEGGEIGFTFGYRDDDGGNWDVRLLWEGDEWNSSTAERYGTLVLGGALPAPTPTPPPGEMTVELVGQIGGQVTAVAVQGEYVYVGVGPALVILDVSDPANPTVVGQSPLFPDMVEDVAVAGDPSTALRQACILGEHLTNTNSS